MNKHDIKEDWTFKQMRERILDNNVEVLLGGDYAGHRNTWLNTKVGGARLIKM